MDESGKPSGYLWALRRGFRFADELGTGCGPVHLLVALEESAGPLHAPLAGAGGQSLRSVVTADPAGLGGGAMYLHAQAQGAARDFAARRDEPVTEAHLLVALLDQAEPRVVEAMRRAQVDAGRPRSSALRVIGAPVGLARIPLPRLTAAGTLDRPSLPLSELPREAWEQLRARQDRLPLTHLHRASDWFAITSNEARAVDRLTKRFGLDDDRSSSLSCHHYEACARRAHDVAPEIVAWPRDPGKTRTVRTRFLAGRRPWRFRHPHLAGWGCWLGNRRVALRAAWLRLSVQH